MAAAAAAYAAGSRQPVSSASADEAAPIDPETSAALDALADSYVADIVDNSSQNA